MTAEAAPPLSIKASRQTGSFSTQGDDITQPRPAPSLRGRDATYRRARILSPIKTSIRLVFVAAMNFSTRVPNDELFLIFNSIFKMILEHEYHSIILQKIKKD